MSSYVCLKTPPQTIKCGPSHTTTCTCHPEADTLWGRNLILTTTPNEPAKSTLNQPPSRRNWSHCRRSRRWPKIHTSLSTSPRRCQ